MGMENARRSSDRPTAGSTSGSSIPYAPSTRSSESGAIDTNRCMQPAFELAAQPAVDPRQPASALPSTEPGTQNGTYNGSQP